MTWYRRKSFYIPAGIVALIIVILGIWVGPVLISAKRAGLLDSIQAEKYQPGREANLKALYVGLMLYHDSEGHFPEGSGWMDAIEPRLQRNGISKTEAQKKLVRPDLADKPGSYGYEISLKAAGKYLDDIQPVDSILISESQQTQRNASGSGSASPGLWSISVRGKIVK